MQQIIIVGLAREALSTYQFLRENSDLALERQLIPQFSQILWLYDDKKMPDLDESWQKIIKNDKNVRFFSDLDQILAETEQFSSNFSAKNDEKSSLRVFKSAGFPIHHPLIERLSAHPHIIFDSNTNLFWRLLQSDDHLKNTTTIGVTGTKGKSTTASLIHHVLKENQLPAFLGGNIGVPPLDLWHQLSSPTSQNVSQKPPIVVLELSSHQLYDLEFSPNIAVIQSITPEHLDYYRDFEEYLQAKASITKFQKPSDLVIFNPEFESVQTIADISPGKKLTFSANHPPIPFDSIQPFPLKGKHNWQNVIPSMVVGKLFGLNHHQIKTAISTFRPLPHRLELVITHQGVEYYNDSMSTNPMATIAALESFANSSVILIAGGYDRGLDYSQLAQKILLHQVKSVILFPPTGLRIKDNLEQLTSGGGKFVPQTPEMPQTPTIAIVQSMEAAVTLARQQAQTGDVVLMSPASASFGMFADYRERGELFSKYARQE